MPDTEAPDAAPSDTARFDTVRFDSKVAVVLRDDLLPWQELNVTAFVISAIATADLDLVGIALRGPRNAVDRTIKGPRMHE